jgi:hypothetical protein
MRISIIQLLSTQAGQNGPEGTVAGGQPAACLLCNNHRLLKESLAQLRPQLPEQVRQLPDEKILALVNWSLIVAWWKTLERLERAGEQKRIPSL